MAHQHQHYAHEEPYGVGQEQQQVTYDDQQDYAPQDNTLVVEQQPQDIVVHETLRGLLRPAAAELVGSALFVFTACGAAMTTSLGSSYTVGAGTIGIALAFGMCIFVLAYSIGHVSGGHLNFAVTFTFAVLRKISILKCVLYFLQGRKDRTFARHDTAVIGSQV